MLDEPRMWSSGDSLGLTVWLCTHEYCRYSRGNFLAMGCGDIDGAVRLSFLTDLWPRCWTMRIPWHTVAEVRMVLVERGRAC